ncbi:hypothetical protein A1O7_09623 [Cladophialophora yegresii CBS 114405]|uniref:Uncharacterized protein n=1 Tax=Cladophialophora yegresii CBS 114405 TaxID=1182544 RepID=W9VMP1_9EURO|nr:uncharacterized protein A1O7_09623 [Cladophialophora yegresii CBS 114405]EXJ54285.1 hypothetical protein A1O7_09623 [Cladophialophora yegresii CBS 114405]
MPIPWEIHQAFAELAEELSFIEVMQIIMLFVQLSRKFCLQGYYDFEDFVLDTYDEVWARDPSLARSGVALVGLNVLVGVLINLPRPAALMVGVALACEMVRLVRGDFYEPEDEDEEEWVYENGEYDEDEGEYEFGEEGWDYDYVEERLDD